MKISIGGGWGGFVRNGAVSVLLALSVSLSFGSSVLPVYSKDFHAPFSADGFFQEFWSSSAAASGSELANLLERQLAARQSTVDYSLRSSIYARFLASTAEFQVKLGPVRTRKSTGGSGQEPGISRINFTDCYAAKRSQVKRESCGLLSTVRTATYIR